MPYKLPTVLTDNGIQFTHRKTDSLAFPPIFSRVCREHGIEHRLTQINPPGTNGQVERMNPTLKEATVKKYPDASHEPLKMHLDHFLNAYNFAKRLNSLPGLSPYVFIVKIWQKAPDRFWIDPTHHTLGLNT